MKALPDVGEVPLVVLVEEGVPSVGEERLVRVHPRPVLAEERLRHEGRVVAVLLGDLLDDEAVREHVVGHVERVRVADVDLVLRRADLVVVVLDRDAHRLERADRVAADARGRVHRRLREVAALVERLRSLLVLEEEVLGLRADVEGVEADRLHALERAAEDVARVAVVRLAVGRDDVADHPARLAVGQDAVGLGIGDRDHVGLLDRVEAGDRRAVEAHPVVERALDLADRDREALQMPLEIGEPQQQVVDPLLLDLIEDVLAGLLARRCPAPALDHAHSASLNGKSPGARPRGYVAYGRRHLSILAVKPSERVEVDALRSMFTVPGRAASCARRATRSPCASTGSRTRSSTGSRACTTSTRLDELAEIFEDRPYWITLDPEAGLDEELLARGYVRDGAWQKFARGVEPLEARRISTWAGAKLAARRARLPAPRVGHPVPGGRLARRSGGAARLALLHRL